MINLLHINRNSLMNSNNVFQRKKNGKNGIVLHFGKFP